MNPRSFQRGVTRFLAVHFLISLVLVTIVSIDSVAGWALFSLFSYIFSWMFLPYMYALILFLWPEATQSFYIPKILAAFLTVILICAFSMGLDTHFTHLALQFFVSMAAGLVAGFLKPIG
ncbi:MAG: hypothetical protein ACHQF2_02390 [Flavobacteriales bacterium]